MLIKGGCTLEHEKEEETVLNGICSDDCSCNGTFYFPHRNHLVSDRCLFGEYSVGAWLPSYTFHPAHFSDSSLARSSETGHCLGDRGSDNRSGDCYDARDTEFRLIVLRSESLPSVK